MKAVVINLDRRPDRWIVTREHLHEQGIKVSRFTAIDNPVGWKGCRDSILSVLESHRSDPYVTILEDDVKFIEPLIYIERAVDQLPLEWDMLYLGGSPRKEQVKYSDNLYRANGVYTTHAILWNYREDGAVEYILSHRDEIKKIDDYLATVIQPKFNCYLMAPLICTQFQSQSDTCKRSDLSTIVSNYNKYCK